MERDEPQREVPYLSLRGASRFLCVLSGSEQ